MLRYVNTVYRHWSKACTVQSKTGTLENNLKSDVTEEY